MQPGPGIGVLVHERVVPPASDMLYSIHFLRFLAALAVVLHHITVDLGSPIMTGAAGVAAGALPIPGLQVQLC
jgi:peptidoglycan/LPS O-acetylase OafA/YrhL